MNELRAKSITKMDAKYLPTMSNNSQVLRDEPGICGLCCGKELLSKLLQEAGTNCMQANMNWMVWEGHEKIAGHSALSGELKTFSCKTPWWAPITRTDECVMCSSAPAKVTENNDKHAILNSCHWPLCEGEDCRRSAVAAWTVAMTVIPHPTEHCDPEVFNALVDKKSRECAGTKMEFPAKNHAAANEATKQLKEMLTATAVKPGNKVGLIMPKDMGPGHY